MEPLKLRNQPNPFQKGNAVDLSKTLLEKENAEMVKKVQDQIAAHKTRLTNVVAEINQVLIDNNVTLQEFNEIIKVFGDRNVEYLGKILISTINNREYVKPSTEPGHRPGGEAIESGQGSPGEGQREADPASPGASGTPA